MSSSNRWFLCSSAASAAVVSISLVAITIQEAHASDAVTLAKSKVIPRMRQLFSGLSLETHCYERAYLTGMALAAEDIPANLVFLKPLDKKALKSPDGKTNWGVYHVAVGLFPSSLKNTERSSALYSRIEDSARNRANCPVDLANSDACKNTIGRDSLSKNILMIDGAFAKNEPISLKEWSGKLLGKSERSAFLWSGPSSYKSSAYEPDPRWDQQRNEFFEGEYRFSRKGAKEDGNVIVTEIRDLPPFSLEELVLVRQRLAADICESDVISQRSKVERLKQLATYMENIKGRLETARPKRLINPQRIPYRSAGELELNCEKISDGSSNWSIRYADKTGLRWLEAVGYRESRRMTGSENPTKSIN